MRSSVSSCRCLEKGDVIIDGGNSLFTDTQRRCKDLGGQGHSLRRLRRFRRRRRRAQRPVAHARRAARIVGNYRARSSRKIAAQVDGEPCCRYMGPDGAGHYVKMVHNGIEYGDMQLICEAYAILSSVLGLTTDELADIFAEWNRGDLDSYLIEITAQIFRKNDPETGKPMVDVILDKAGQKGTGIWTLQSAIQQSVVISTINAAVEARVISSRKEERVAASKILPQPKVEKFTGDRDELDHSGARRALRLEDCFLRAGDGIVRRGEQAVQLEARTSATSPRSGAAAASFERSFSTAFARPMNAIRPAQFAARFLLHRDHREDAAQLAHRGRDRGQARRGGAGLQRVVRLLRQLSAGAAAFQPSAGATRLLRRAHLRAGR